MSYSPTTWKSGDVVTSAKLNKLEQGVAEAGSGGGGWNTIPVTFVNTGTNPYKVIMNNVADGMLRESVEIPGDGSVVVNVLVYGSGAVYPLASTFADVDMNVAPVATGGVSFDANNLTIVGEGTFTAAGQQII